MLLPSGSPVHVTDAEQVARHVYSKHHIGTEDRDPHKKFAKAQAFLPLASQVGWVFSVTRLHAFADDEAIQRNGIAIGAVGDRGLKGSAILEVKAIRQVSMRLEDGGVLQQLDVVAHEAADGSTPYHAHVTGFLPLPDGVSMKEFFKEAAEDLARKARTQRFVVRTVAAE